MSSDWNLSGIERLLSKIWVKNLICFISAILDGPIGTEKEAKVSRWLWESRRESGRPLHFQNSVAARHLENWRVVKRRGPK